MYKQPPSQKISTEWVERSASVNLIQFTLSCPDFAWLAASLKQEVAKVRANIFESRTVVDARLEFHIFDIESILILFCELI